MRPDLFAGPGLRDDSHRILARLANGGSIPAPKRQSKTWQNARRRRVAAVVGILACCAAAWAWLRDGGPAPHALPVLPSGATATHGARPASTFAQQTAANIDEEPYPAAVAAPAPAEASAQASRAAREAPTPARLRAVRPTPVPSQRTQRAVPAQESDEDVALLTAMLKHANQQKPAPIPPKD